MTTHDLRWLLHVCKIRWPNAAFATNSSLVDDVAREKRRRHVAVLERTIRETRAELARRDQLSVETHG